MRTAFLIAVIALISISVGSTVLALANIYYSASESLGPYTYEVDFGEGIHSRDLGVLVNLNLSSFARTWFVSEQMNVVLDVSMEKQSSLVQNFSWRAFWVELFAFEDRVWQIVAHGSAFLDQVEQNSLRLERHQVLSVGIVNLHYFESVDEAWFRVGIMMDVRHSNTEYSLTFYTPIGEIGPISVLSPLYSPVSLATIFAAATTALTAAISPALARRFPSKSITLMKKKSTIVSNEKTQRRLSKS